MQNDSLFLLIYLQNCIDVLDEEKMMALSKQDNIARTALHYAACANYSGIVDMLLENHSSAAYILDNDGYSPLHIAVALDIGKQFYRCLITALMLWSGTTREGGLLFTSLSFVTAAWRDCLKNS
eukprot:TRINITY_DN103087_c0_g1_i1.p1 TRINITY_DN103087_c0_g1~~TRINITY_DN103087_c0_g1_i1.p1  ORF type:complete len:124 (-),score=20.74 TRINITY_DN103087_c0_g1_i1:464-835(-)